MKNRNQETPSKGVNLSEFDWNFDKVPDGELIACCYWEYARESAFIREVRKRSWEHWKPLYLKDQWWNAQEDKRIHEDMQKVQSIGYPAEVFLHGFSCPPDGVLPDAPPLKPGEVHRLTGSFPKPWQKLTKEERAYRAHMGNDVERIPLVPFKRALFLDAKDIVEWVGARRRESYTANERVRRENPTKSEEALQREGKLCFPEIQPSLYWAGGKEVTVVAINWAAFTNDEIANYFRRWVKANRPKSIKSPSGQGHKAKDCRAQLTRLAVMRLLAHFSALEIVDDRRNKFPAIWETKQFSGRKWEDVTKWHDARREAGRLFRMLFPFLAPDEKPLSWERQRPGK